MNACFAVGPLTFQRIEIWNVTEGMKYNTVYHFPYFWKVWIQHGSGSRAPQDFAINERCPFYFRKCSISFRKKCLWKCYGSFYVPKFKMLHTRSCPCGPACPLLWDLPTLPTPYHPCHASWQVKVSYCASHVACDLVARKQSSHSNQNMAQSEETNSPTRRVKSHQKSNLLTPYG